MPGKGKCKTKNIPTSMFIENLQFFDNVIFRVKQDFELSVIFFQKNFGGNNFLSIFAAPYEEITG